MSKITKIKLNLGKRSYEIIIGRKIISRFPEFLKKLNLGANAIVITNSLIKRTIGNQIDVVLKKHNFTVKFFQVPDSEKAKSAKVALKLIQRIAAFDVKKRVFIIALGGGVIGDLAGYVAATYKRGIPYVQFPTTLLGQIDSSIGGKVGIDLEIGKNLVGAFYQPRLVFSDVSILSSLDLRQVRCGLAEAIKYALIKDLPLFKFLEKNYAKILKLEPSAIEPVIFRCSKIKAKVVEQDEREERGVRTILNFGHTIGHAIEAAAGYKFYTHGEAIGLGMLCSCEISQRLGILDFNSFLRIEKLLCNVGLPVKIKKLELKDIVNTLAHDKKFIFGKNRFVLPLGIGRVRIYQDIHLNLIKSVIIGRMATK